MIDITEEISDLLNHYEIQMSEVENLQNDCFPMMLEYMRQFLQIHDLRQDIAGKLNTLKAKISAIEEDDFENEDEGDE